jgi:sugar lactone lactonase YvrE
MSLLVPGTVFAGHRIESLLGRGGMGVVYRARELALDRVVALKVIAPELLDDGAARERFVGEARVAGAIEHPNVIPLYYAGEAEGTAYLAMRYVEGADVRTLVRTEGALPPARAVAIAAQAGAALDAIHAAGFVHRDVKPGNLLLDGSGHVYLTDFGLARRMLTRGGVTRSGHWVGTLDYVAPEQIRGGRIDARADVYGLGGVLHFMLTGHVPFEREEEATLWAHLVAPPPRPSLLRPGLPAALDAVVQRALAKDPDERQPSAGDLARAAASACSGVAATAPERMVARGAASPAGAPREAGLAEEVPTLTRPPPLPAGVRGGRRRALPLGLVAALAAAAAAAATIALRGEGDPAPATGERSTPTASAAPAERPTATAAAAARAGVRVGRVVRDVIARPNGIAYARGDLWVVSRDAPRVTRIRAATGSERRSHPYVGRGTLDIAAGPSGVYVAVGALGRVVRLDPRSGRVLGRIQTPLHPVGLALGEKDLWVVGRAGDGAPDSLTHYTADGRLLQSLSAGAPVTGIALGRGALWVVTRHPNRVNRLDLRTGQLEPWARLDTPGFAVAYDAGSVWVTMRGADAVARVDVRSHAVVLSATGRAPAAVVTARRRVLVACTYDHTVVSIHPGRVSPLGRPLPVPFNPYAMTAVGSHVWVTNFGADAITRLDVR